MTIRSISSILSSCMKTGTIALFSALSTAAFTSTHATPLSHSFPGEELDLSAPCARTHIRIDSTLKEGIALDEAVNVAPTVHNIHDGAENKLVVALQGCPSNGRMIMRLSNNTALTLHDSAQSTLTITGTLTTLESDLTDATLSLDRVQSLDLSMHGNTHVHMHQLDRAAQIIASDNSQFTADIALLSALSAQLDNNGKILINQGQVDDVTLITANNSSATLLSQIENASIIAKDTSTVNFNKITGSFQQSGSGHIQQVSSVPLTVQQPIIPPPTQNTVPSSPEKPLISPHMDGTEQGLNNNPFPSRNSHNEKPISSSFPQTALPQKIVPPQENPASLSSLSDKKSH